MERLRFSVFAGSILKSFEEIYYYHKDGTLDAPHWAETEQMVTDFAALPGIQGGGRGGDTGTQTNSPRLSIK